MPEQILRTRKDVRRDQSVMGRAGKKIMMITYWNGVRQVVVYEGLLAKFSQNDELKDNHCKGTGNSDFSGMCGERIESGVLDCL